MPVIQVGTAERAQEALIQVLGIEIAALMVAAIVAVLYRWRTARPIPSGTGAFAGLGTVATWLLADMITTGSVVVSLPFESTTNAIYAIVAVSIGSPIGIAGGRLGDRVACEIYDIDRLTVDGEIGELLRSAHVVVRVNLPETIVDAGGYLPIDDGTREKIAGTQFRFPGRLGPSEIAARVESRIVSDFDVDHADVSIEGETVTRVAAGKHRDGIGPTLPPDTAAVSIHADAGGDASPGEPVEIWHAEGADNRLVGRGRLRTKRGNYATVVVDEADALAFDHADRYRLVTPPELPSDRHRLVALLRDVDETTVAVTIERASDIEGEFVGWLPGTVLAIERGDEVLATPNDRVTLQAGDTAFLVGHPAEFEAADLDLGGEDTSGDAVTPDPSAASSHT